MENFKPHFRKTKALFVVIIIFFGFLSCQNSTSTISEQNKEIVLKAFKVVGAGDYDNMGNYISDNYIRHCQATPQLSIKSLAEFKEFIRLDRLSIPDQKLKILHLVAEDDMVAFWAKYIGIQTGQMGPFPPSNKEDELDFSGIHRLKDGKIVETWITWDNLAILSQLGHFPHAE